MSPSDRVITFRPDEEILAGMEALKEQDGTPFSEQVRRALREWLANKGAMKAGRKRAGTRKRS